MGIKEAVTPENKSQVQLITKDLTSGVSTPKTHALDMRLNETYY